MEPITKWMPQTAYFVGKNYISDGLGINNPSPDGRLDIIHNSTGAASPHIMITATNANTGSRIVFDNEAETTNNWVMFARADDTSTDSRFNIFHNGTGNIMVVTGDGKVGINRTPATNALEVGGDASKTTAGAWLANSDRRLKKNIEGIEGKTALQKIEQMRGVTYLWNDTQTGINRPENLQYGFIAQELMEVFPEKVTQDNLGFYQTAYGDYDPLFVEAIKELKKEVETLSEENQKLKAQLLKFESLEARLSALENGNATNINSETTSEKKK
ncbi:MAG: tail fiber domain-containing protein [Flavobacteriaceae bacterium]